MSNLKSGRDKVSDVVLPMLVNLSADQLKEVIVDLKTHIEQEGLATKALRDEVAALKVECQQNLDDLEQERTTVKGLRDAQIKPFRSVRSKSVLLASVSQRPDARTCVPFACVKSRLAFLHGMPGHRAQSVLEHFRCPGSQVGHRGRRSDSGATGSDGVVLPTTHMVYGFERLASYKYFLGYLATIRYPPFLFVPLRCIDTGRQTEGFGSVVGVV